ncbi:MAG: trimeric autotransporter adhesin [Blastocatellia bacterium]|jgi:hypothetical protein|nr:trimeric autotransporter adhesin [Blastocatellia bacterium]
MFIKIFDSSRLAVRSLLTVCVAACVVGLTVWIFNDPASQARGGHPLARTLPTANPGIRSKSARDVDPKLATDQSLKRAVSATLDEIKLTASNGEASDYAGYSVAISGTTAVIGAFGHRAFVFVRQGDEWQLQQTLTIGEPSDRELEFYGVSVAIDGGTILLGDHIPPQRSESNPDEIDWRIGDIYVYVRSGTQWTLQHTFPAPPPPDPYQGVFPTSLGISGNSVIIGLSGIDNSNGAVFFSDRTGNTWSPVQKLSANERTSGDNDFDSFGARVAIEGDTAVVTAPDVDIDTTDFFNEGAAYVYVRSGGAWIEQGYLTASEDELPDTYYMGLSVDISGDTVVVGGPNGDNAFVFVRNGTTWSEQQMLRAFHGVNGDGFGKGVAINGNKIVVGAPVADDNLGAVYVFERTGETWFEGDTLNATTGVPTPGHGLAFGYSVAVSGNTIIAGAPNEQVGVNDRQGAAYVFQKADRDGDALPDEWEILGISVDDSGVVIGAGDLGVGTFIDLPRMGADPMHKDIFVHADWMAPTEDGVVLKPDETAIKFVTDAFAVAPVDNPDGQAGIHLHVDLGPDSIMNPVTGEIWGALSMAGETQCQEEIGTIDADAGYEWSEVDAVKAERFEPSGRKVVFHYALFCNTFADQPSSGISRGNAASDFLVSLGEERDAVSPGGTLEHLEAGGSPLQQAGTFMHEIGHNLGLRHGGGDNTVFKPNYLSVMNYYFQFTGLLSSDGQRALDYSQAALPPLDQTNLDEAAGIADPEEYLTLWNGPSRSVNPSGPNKCLENENGYYKIFLPGSGLDWNCNSALTLDPVNVRLVNDAAAPDTLEGFDDWGHLIFDGGGRIGDLGAGGSGPKHSSNDELPSAQIMAAVPPALFTEELAAPHDVVTLSPQSGASPLSVNFDGSNSTTVSGTIVNYAWDFGDGSTGSGATLQHSYSTPGIYCASLTVTDSNGHVNLAPLLHSVTVIEPGPTPSPTATPTPTPQPNLTPYQPAGWSDKLVVSTTTGTHSDSATIIAGDSLYVDFAINNGGNVGTTEPFTATLYVDDVAMHDFVVNALNGSTYIFVEDFPIAPLSAGQHTIKIIADVNGAIAESNESDNVYSKPIAVSPAAPTPTPTPTPSPTPTPIPISLTFTVRNTNNSGVESLRQALLDANSHPNGADGIDQIVFDIPGAGVHTITPTTDLPLVSDPVLIDGYTQPGASANTQLAGNDAVLLIELNCANLGQDGLNFSGGSSTIRGLVINNFNSAFAFTSAIRLTSSNNVVVGNFIGTTASGAGRAPNTIGITVASGANNLIGGSTPADRNVVAGSATQIQPAAGVGIMIKTTQAGTRVQGNYIGTNAAGNAAFGNGRGINVDVAASADITIGGLTNTPGTGVGNVISGNSSNGGVDSYGIYIDNRPRGDVRIQGNLIGLNGTGTEALSNGVSGIHVRQAASGTFNPDPTLEVGSLWIGGTESGARNVIFNNRINGIFTDAVDLNLIVQGNFIGTDITGTTNPPLGAGSHDGGDGILVGDGTITIGGNSAAARNVISCPGRGLHVAAGVATVQGNFIGTTVDGITALGNKYEGVRVENAAVAIVGGSSPGQGNLIAHNFFAGVEVMNTARATILGNSIFDNGTTDVNTFQGHPGIDLNDDGVTPNDACDADNGPNVFQNYPALTSAVVSAGATTFTGSLNSKAGTAFRIEFFSNPACEVSGNGEGRTFVGSTTISTGESCNANINVTLPFAVPVGLFITTTATDPNGNTSEFGPCVQVTAPGPTAADGAVSGRILDTNGNAVAGVGVRLSGSQDRVAVTNAAGNYRFDGVETNGLYIVTPSRANYSFTPANRAFSALGNITEAAFTAVADATQTANPLDTTEYFVRQHYLDFLGREPDQGGLEYWNREIARCGNDVACVNRRRLDVSAAFFMSQEFQETGSFVYGLYQASFGSQPTYIQFIADRAKVVGGADLEARKEEMANEWVQRDRFRMAYPDTLTPEQLVNKLFENAGLQAHTGAWDTYVVMLQRGGTRAQLLRMLMSDSQFTAKEFNATFVLMEYFAYLRRDPDPGGYAFWLDVLNQREPGNFRGMICSFITATEYQQRFSSAISRSNAECGR